MTLESVPAYSGFRSGPLGQAYNEAAFRYFLAVDRRRADRWMRSLLLVLAAVRQSPGRSTMLTDALAAELFSGFGACFREIDFVGWYRQGRVAAAVLPQGVNVSSDVPHLIADRVVGALRTRLSTVQPRNLRVRVVLLGGTRSSQSR